MKKILCCYYKKDISPSPPLTPTGPITLSRQTPNISVNEDSTEPIASNQTKILKAPIAEESSLTVTVNKANYGTISSSSSLPKPPLTPITTEVGSPVAKPKSNPIPIPVVSDEKETRQVGTYHGVANLVAFVGDNLS